MRLFYIPALIVAIALQSWPGGILYTAVCGLIGYASGAYLSMHSLVGLSVLTLGAAACLIIQHATVVRILSPQSKARGFERLFLFSFLYPFGIIFVSSWATFYMLTGQTFVDDGLNAAYQMLQGTVLR